MKVTAQASGWIAVDGEAKRVAEVLDLGNGVEALTYDTDANRGRLQYYDSVKINVQVRDFDAERELNAQNRAANLPESTEPIYKVISVSRPDAELVNYDVTWLLEAWDAYVPPQDPEIPPEVIARQEDLRLDTEAALDDSVGAVEPKTFRELRDMTRPQLRAWFDANFTTDAQLRRLIRWIFIFLARRM